MTRVEEIRRRVTVPGVCNWQEVEGPGSEIQVDERKDVKDVNVLIEMSRTPAPGFPDGYTEVEIEGIRYRSDHESLYVKSEEEELKGRWVRTDENTKDLVGAMLSAAFRAFDRKIERCLEMVRYE